MLDRAKQLVPDAANVAWIQANGSDWSDAPDESVDFAFSYLVSQHLPDKKLVRGYIQELRQLRRECASWRGKWVLVQYTALGWSRRGFPFGALAVLVILRRGGARVAVVFHEPDRQAGSSLLQGASRVVC